MSIVLVFGSVVFVGWTLLETWIRLAPVEHVQVTDRKEGTGPEGSSYKVRVVALSTHQNTEKWVSVRQDQYASLDTASVLAVHVRRLGEWTLVRAQRWGRVWLVGFLALYFVFNLIIKVFDL